MGWHLLAVAVICLGCALGMSPVYLRWRREQLDSLWDDIYIRLRERYAVLRAFVQFAAKDLGSASIPREELQKRLRQLEETNDPLTHADLQNAFVPAILKAVERLHRDPRLRDDYVWQDTFARLDVIDSGLAHLRDRYNECARRYNELLYRFPFSLAASLLGLPEKPAFPLMIHWWSRDPEAYGGMGVPAIDIESLAGASTGDARDSPPSSAGDSD
jgi:hypothetical protein